MMLGVKFVILVDECINVEVEIGILEDSFLYLVMDVSSVLNNVVDGFLVVSEVLEWSGKGWYMICNVILLEFVNGVGWLVDILGFS